MIVYNDNVKLLQDSSEQIEFTISDIEDLFQVNADSISYQPASYIGDLALDDQVLFKKEFADHDLIFYIKAGGLLAVRVSHVPKEDFHITETSYELVFNNLTDFLSIKQTGETSYSVYDQSGKFLFSIDDLVSTNSNDYLYPIDLEISTTEYRYLMLGRVNSSSFYNFIVYDLFKKEISIQKVMFNVDSNDADLVFNLMSPELLEVSSRKETVNIEFKKVSRRGMKLFEFYQLEDKRDMHMLGALTINGAKYFIHNKLNGVFMTRGNPISVTGFRPNMRMRFFGKNLFIVGRNTHYAYNANRKYDYLYIDGLEKPIAKFRRPMDSKLLRRYGYFKIPVSALNVNLGMPNNFYIGDQRSALHNLKLKPGTRKAKILAYKKSKDQVALIRTSSRGNISSSIVSETEEYTFSGRIAASIQNLKKSKFLLKLFRILFVLMGRTKRKEKLVIFESFHAKQYSDNPRAIYEYMKEFYPEYRLLWSIDKQAKQLFEDFKVPYVMRFTLRWFLTFPRAKYWVNNVRLPGWMPKPKGTVYLQTWHGTPLKKLGIDIDEIHMPGTKTETYKRNFVTESQKWDFLISPNSFSSEVFRRAFHYPGEVIESGYPRNDVLTNHSSDLISELKKRIGIPDHKKVMLYAPTWRDNEFYQKGKYKFEFQFDLDHWKEEFGSDWVLLSRMHYLVAENFDFSAHEGVVYDVSSYPDIRDLYLISDLMITDYSSVFFDYAILNRPIIFFMYDLDLYRDQLRGFYIDIEADAPGPIVQTEEELFLAIKELKDADVEMNPTFDRFKKKFSILEDGHATQRVVQAFLKQPEKSE